MLHAATDVDTLASRNSELEPHPADAAAQPKPRFRLLTNTPDGTSSALLRADLREARGMGL